MLNIYKLNRLCVLLARAGDRYDHYVSKLQAIGVIVTAATISYHGLTIVNRITEYIGV